jgi:hypothetical protein
VTRHAILKHNTRYWIRCDSAMSLARTWACALPARMRGRRHLGDKRRQCHSYYLILH